MRKFESVGFNGETGEKKMGYQLICPNNKADSEGHSDDIIDLTKKEYGELLKESATIE